MPGGPEKPLVREVCVGLARGEVGGGRGGVVVRDWGGNRQCGRGPRSWTERRSRASAERGSSHLGRGSSVLQESEMDLDSSELRV